MENKPKENKSIFIYLIEFVVGYLFVLGFLCLAFENKLPETNRLLLASLVLATIILGLAERKNV